MWNGLDLNTQQSNLYCFTSVEQFAYVQSDWNFTDHLTTTAEDFPTASNRSHSQPHSLFASEDSIFSATLPDSHTPYQIIRSFKSAPRREMAIGGGFL